LPDTPHFAGLGLLRSPTRGKPAHHKKAGSPQKSLLTTKKPVHDKKARKPQKKARSPEKCGLW